MNILLIEDDVLLLKIMRFHLIQSGHRVIDTSNGEEAYMLYQSNSIDLIISDIFMPYNSGVTAIKKIQNSSMHKTPVIIISGIENSEYYLANRQVRYHSFLHKPFTTDQLLEKVQALNYELSQLYSKVLR
jgi:DNA-binding response OmpR family regulator